ncbi:hypothetical protein KIN20_014122 [Parelaphostrongylus tenuis]|uniref:Uncharacterized protein n=1 Tax=Parelaphostrongylus tenuis TaxID=148309 RepID=A0AAD5QN47_PARTN|nr:hypothetical protein KIN20_014122 [Parelaphostrongylus tenuis]
MKQQRKCCDKKKGQTKESRSQHHLYNSCDRLNASNKLIAVVLLYDEELQVAGKENVG